ncbi:MAG: ABC transporter permease [Candidatus Aminicenantaceae bacterium]
MFKNYLKSALRNLFKHKGYSLINIVGLAIGMASCLLILLYVRHELSYDAFHENADQIYRVAMEARWGGRDFDIAVNAAPMAKTLVAEYPEIVDAVRFRGRGDYIVQYGDTSFREQRVIFADPTVFSVFSIPLLKGDPETVLSSPNTLVVSRKTAEKYFRDEDPIGKTLRLENQDDFQVTGVFEEIPNNSHFHFDIMLTMESLQESKAQIWLSQNFQTYILLRDDADWTEMDAKLTGVMERYFGPQIAQFIGKSWEEIVEDGEMFARFYLQPLRSIHLHSDLQAEIEPTSDIRYVYIFSAIALFVLLIASINFMNLATARSAGRAKEVGIRKVMGSFRRQLVLQFLMESFLLSFMSMALAIGLVLLVLPLFNNLAGKTLFMSLLFQGPMIAIIVLITALTGFLAGSYPAFFISGFQPVNTLKGQLRTGLKSGRLRSGLVIFQFAASIILIIGTFVVQSQLHYVQNKKLGFEKEQVLILNNAYLLSDQAEAFRDAMLTYSQFTNGTISGYLPIPSNRNQSAVFPEGELDSAEATSFQNWIVDYDYIDTLGIKIVEGRNFSREFSTDVDTAIINQAVLKQFGWLDSKGKRLGRIISEKGDVKLYNVIGVVEDFHYESLRNTIAPLVMYLGNSRGLMSFRITTENVTRTIGLLESKWKEFRPNQPFEYMFMDERFNQLYRTEQRIGKIVGVFATLAVVIGCLGLFGLAAFTAEQRTKEIGIHKVLGASAPGIIRLLLREFVILVGLANLVAWPLAYLVMRRWLQDFAYRVSPSVWIFLLAGLLTLFIALFTVSFQAVKAALADPIRSLRYE